LWNAPKEAWPGDLGRVGRVFGTSFYIRTHSSFFLHTRRSGNVASEASAQGGARSARHSRPHKCRRNPSHRSHPRLIAPHCVSQAQRGSAAGETWPGARAVHAPADLKWKERFSDRSRATMDLRRQMTSTMTRGSLDLELHFPQVPRTNTVRNRAQIGATLRRLTPGANRDRHRKLSLARAHSVRSLSYAVRYRQRGSSLGGSVVNTSQFAQAARSAFHTAPPPRILCHAHYPTANSKLGSSRPHEYRAAS
jgi:hypothetical protein